MKKMVRSIGLDPEQGPRQCRSRGTSTRPWAELKHAYDKWNSKPVLVTTEKYEKEAHSLLAGSFHEIRHVASVVNCQRIVELYRLLRKTWNLKEDMGTS